MNLTACVFFLLFSLQTVPLSFVFTFYGHEVKQITIATGGMKFIFVPWILSLFGQLMEINSKVVECVLIIFVVIRAYVI